VRDSYLDPTARRQHGVFHRRQAVEAGFTRRMIESRLASGTWVRLDRAVYALSSHPFTWERQAMAATLAVADSAISGRAAAALHGIGGIRPGALEVTAPSACKAKSDLATVRRSDFYQATRVRGIPCLTVAHTVLSMAPRFSVGVLGEVLDDALARRLVRLDEMQRVFTEWVPRRPAGAARLRTLLRERDDSFVPTTSVLERRLRRFLTTTGIRFAYEYELPWWPRGEGRVDAYSRAHTLIVEADGRAWHTRERDFAKDRRRDNLAAANGHVTLRFTWADLRDDRGPCRELVRKTVATRSTPG
jgi:very-short-patch-repair endonuclease